MNTSAYEIVLLLCILLLCGKLFIAIRLDRLRTNRNNFLVKFLVGLYLLEAFLPILRTGASPYEQRLIKTANILGVLFYLLLVSLFIAIWAL